MSRATLFKRNNGFLGASYRGIEDTGYDAVESDGLFTVHDHDGEILVENVTREEAESAIAKDWDRGA